MKKDYLKPELEFFEFTTENVIAASGEIIIPDDPTDPDFIINDLTSNCTKNYSGTQTGSYTGTAASSLALGQTGYYDVLRSGGCKFWTSLETKYHVVFNAGEHVKITHKSDGSWLVARTN